MPSTIPFTRELHGGEIGLDVEGIGRALVKAGFLLDGLPAPIRIFAGMPATWRRTYGARKKAAVNAFRKVEGRKQNGVYDELLHFQLIDAEAFDAKAEALMRAWTPPKPKPPPLVEPKQTFSSLDKSLWEPYSVAITSVGGYDLGTFNPASTLPSGAKSDHAVFPAMAFDVGFRPWSGWWNPLARRGFWKMAKHPAVEYVILGDKIHSKERGLHAYTGGGHLNHVHVSGHR